MDPVQPTVKKGRRVKAAVVFWLLFVAMLFLLQAILTDRRPATSSDEICGFYAVPKNTLDVVFIGSSVMFCSADPNVMYHEYGFTSYAFGSGMLGMNTALCMLEEALRTQSPKTIVLEATLLAPLYAQQPNDGYGGAIWFLPLSRAKLRLAAKLDTPDETAAAILPIYQFHSRWSELTKDDVARLFSDRNNDLLGFHPREDVYRADAYSTYYGRGVDGARSDGIQPEVLSFIRSAKAMCDKRGCKLILATFPSVDGRQPSVYPFYNTLSDVLGQMGVPYINYLLEDDRLRLGKRDISDEKHLTVTGAHKFSLAVGADLTSLIALDDRRQDPDYAYYAARYAGYAEQMLSAKAAQRAVPHF